MSKSLLRSLLALICTLSCYRAWAGDAQMLSRLAVMVRQLEVFSPQITGFGGSPRVVAAARSELATHLRDILDRPLALLREASLWHQQVFEVHRLLSQQLDEGRLIFLVSGGFGVTHMIEPTAPVRRNIILIPRDIGEPNPVSDIGAIPTERLNRIQHKILLEGIHLADLENTLMSLIAGAADRSRLSMLLEDRVTTPGDWERATSVLIANQFGVRKSGIAEYDATVLEHLLLGKTLEQSRIHALTHWQTHSPHTPVPEKPIAVPHPPFHPKLQFADTIPID